MGVAMNQTDQHYSLTPQDDLHSSSSAELSDIDHKELISHYGSDQYLRKWTVEEEENAEVAELNDKDKWKHELQVYVILICSANK